jgi:hypothetical protein
MLLLVKAPRRQAGSVATSVTVRAAAAAERQREAAPPLPTTFTQLGVSADLQVRRLRSISFAHTLLHDWLLLPVRPPCVAFSPSHSLPLLFLDLHEQTALAEKGITAPTEIQAAAVPALLRDRVSDFMLASHTGSGKTLAYLVPIGAPHLCCCHGWVPVCVPVFLSWLGASVCACCSVTVGCQCVCLLFCHGWVPVCVPVVLSRLGASVWCGIPAAVWSCCGANGSPLLLPLLSARRFIRLVPSTTSPSSLLPTDSPTPLPRSANTVQLLKEGEELQGAAAKPKRPRALVLGPTRELTDQILQVAKVCADCV